MDLQMVPTRAFLSTCFGGKIHVGGVVLRHRSIDRSPQTGPPVGFMFARLGRPSAPLARFIGVFLVHFRLPVFPAVWPITIARKKDGSTGVIRTVTLPLPASKTVAPPSANASPDKT